MTTFEENLNSVSVYETLFVLFIFPMIQGSLMEHSLGWSMGGGEDLLQPEEYEFKFYGSLDGYQEWGD